MARLHAFLKPKNPGATARAVQAIRAGVRLPTAYPEIGRPADDIDPAFREWPINFGADGYITLYRCDDGEVIILAVRQGSEARR